MKLPKELTTVTPVSKALTFIFLVASPFVGFLFGLKYQESLTLSLAQASSSEVQYRKPNSTKTRARQFFLTDKFFKDQAYPSFLAAMPIADLVPMACTPQYTINGEQINAMLRDQATPVTDPKVMELSQKISSSLSKGSKIVSFFSCDTEDNRTLVEYEYLTSANKNSGQAEIGLLSQGSVSKIMRLSEKASNNTCSKILQLTKDQSVYLQCGDGDNASDAYIYKINLEKKTMSTTEQCHSLEKNGSTAEEIQCSVVGE